MEKVDFSINQVIDNLETLTKLRAKEKGLNLAVEKSQQVPEYVIGDPNRLHQILLNLIGNAIKFTEKGYVKLKTELVNQPDELAKIRFIVEDTGIGIEPNQLEKIFGTFEQAEKEIYKKFGGTGLGLSISKHLVELQGGIIKAESEVGKGSRFIVELTFPIARANEQKPEFTETKEVIEIESKLIGIRILLVEDNEFNVMVAKEAIEDSVEEASVIVAYNGKEAIEKLKSIVIDVVLMDIQMPVMNGFEATEQIRQLQGEKSKIPIIAMTANVMKEEVEKCKEVGMDEYISKPFETKELLAKILKLVEKPKIPR